jgi:DNA-binding transcriptional LysR family regulator
MPKLSINLIERDWRDIMVAIASETIDFGIIDVSIAEKSDQFQYKRLPRYLCSVVVRFGHPLVGKSNLSINDLSNYPYCGPNPSRWAIDESGIAAKIFGEDKKDNNQLMGSFNAHTFYTSLNIVLNTDSFTILPKIVFDYQQKKNKLFEFSSYLTPIEVEGLTWLRTNYGIVWRSNRKLTDFDEKFIEIIENIENEIASKCGDEIVDKSYMISGR